VTGGIGSWSTVSGLWPGEGHILLINYGRVFHARSLGRSHVHRATGFLLRVVRSLASVQVRKGSVLLDLMESMPYCTPVTDGSVVERQPHVREVPCSIPGAAVSQSVVTGRSHPVGVTYQHKKRLRVGDMSADL